MPALALTSPGFLTSGESSYLEPLILPQAIHEQMNCKEYQDDLALRAQNDRKRCHPARSDLPTRREGRCASP